MSKKIIIDPGHGGTDPGASGFGIKEKDWNLRISLYQYKRLKELGANVAITRTTDQTLDSVPRANLIKGKYDFCISNHWNAFNGTARGVETIYNFQQPRAFADELANALVKLTSLPLRRVFQRKNDEGTNYYFMHRLTGGVNTVIIEYGFIDNKVDHDWYKNETNFYKAAEAVIEVVCKHIGIAYKHGSKVTPPKPTPAPVHKSVDQLAQEVIKGLHGTGEVRQKRLGSQYAAVQARVNQLLAPNSKPVPKPAPKPTPKPTVAKSWKEHGFFYTDPRPDTKIYVRDQPSLKGKIIAEYYIYGVNEKLPVEYHTVHINDGYVWLQYDRIRNGVVIGQGYIPCREYKNGKAQRLWGTIK